jgi:hypothetical protein
MKRRPVQLHIGTVSVGSQVPIGKSALGASISHHLTSAFTRSGGDIVDKKEPVHIPEVRVRAHSSMGLDSLGEHVAREIGRKIRGVE